jgi:hypothetical protein
MIRKEGRCGGTVVGVVDKRFARLPAYVSDSVLKELRRIIEESEIIAYAKDLSSVWRVDRLCAVRMTQTGRRRIALANKSWKSFWAVNTFRFRYVCCVCCVF